MNEKNGKKYVKIGEFVQQLLDYIEIPYFKNNPTYIDWWRKYYEHTKDQNILLLLFNLRISTCYHWIYIEFSKIFLEMKRPDIAFFILKIALETDVYDQKVLKEALLTIPKFQPTCSDKEIYKIFKKQKIKCMGRVFNIKENKIVSIEDNKYKKENNDTVITCEDKENNSEINKENVNCNKIKDENERVNENEGVNKIFKVEEMDKIENAINEKQSNNNNLEGKKANIKFFSLEAGEYLVLDRISLFIKSAISQGSFECMNLAENDETVVESFCVAECAFDKINNLDFEYFFEYENKNYVIFKYSCLCKLSEVMNQNNFSQQLYKYYYLEKILRYVKTFPNATLHDFYVDSDFNVNMMNFTFSQKNSLLEQIQSYYSEINFKSSVNEIYKSIKLFEDTENYQNEIYEHKKQLLEE